MVLSTHTFNVIDVEPKNSKFGRVPFAPLNNIKMIITKKKILPKRKCVSAVCNYQEPDVEADDSYFCKHFVVSLVM